MVRIRFFLLLLQASLDASLFSPWILLKVGRVTSFFGAFSTLEEASESLRFAILFGSGGGQISQMVRLFFVMAFDAFNLC